MKTFASANAAHLARMGRHGDTRLLHVSTDELKNLGRLGHLSINPRTGLPEAFGLGSITHAISNAVSSVGNALTSNPVANVLTGGLGSAVNAGNRLGGAVGGTFQRLGSNLGTAASNAWGNIRGNPLGTFTGGLGGSALGTGGFDYLARSPQQNQTSMLGVGERMLGTGIAGAGAGALAAPALGSLGAIGASAGTKAGINALGGGAAGQPMQHRVPLAASSGGDASWGVNPQTGAAGAAGAGASGVGGSDWLSSLLGGGASLAGSNEALKAYEEAQHNAEAAGRFAPWNVTSGMGNTSFGTGGVTSSLNPQYQGVHDTLLQNAQGQLGAAGAFDPMQASDQYYQQLQAQAQPYEAQDRANALAQLQAMGQTGLGVGGDSLSGPSNPLYSSVLRAQSDAARQRQITAQTMAQQIANSTQQRGVQSLSAGQGLDQNAFQQGQFGADLGQSQMRGQLAGASLAQSPLLAQGATKGGMLGGFGSQMGAGGVGGAGGILSKLGGLANNSTLFGSGGLSGMLGGVGKNIGSLFGGSKPDVTGGLGYDPDELGQTGATNFGGLGYDPDQLGQLGSIADTGEALGGIGDIADSGAMDWWL